MIAAGYGVIAVMCLAVLTASFRLWRTHRNAITLLILIPLLFLWLDNFAIATGRLIGEGPVLLAMSYLRFFWHWATLPLLFIVAGALARRAGFRWAQNKYVMALFCITAIVLIIEDTRFIFQIEFHPACYGDTLRMVTDVKVWQMCEPGTPPPASPSPGPIAAIGVNIVLMIIGFAMWWKDRFPWLALGAVLMFGCAALGAKPDFFYGQILGNFGEPIFNAGLVAAGWRYAGKPARS